MVVVNRVVEVARDLGDVEAAKARYASLRVECAGPGQQREDSERLLKLSNEDFLMIPVLEPPLLLTLDVTACRGGESDPPRGQRERSSLRISSASTSRSAATSACESRRAW